MKHFISLFLIILIAGNVSSQISCNNWLKITGSPDGVRIGDLDVTGTNITVEAVFNRTAPYSPSYAYAGDIVSKHVDPTDCNYLLRPRHAEITTTNGFFATPPACDFQLTKTYHVAMVYNGSTLRFYRNGFLLSQVNATGNLINNNWLTKIGETAGVPYNTSTTSLVGYINEVRIWNVSRTQQEIRTYMNASLPNPTTQTGLLAYYTFNNLLNKQGNVLWNGISNGSAVINATNPSCSLMADSCNVILPTSQLCTGSLGDPVVNITFGSGSNPGQPLQTIVAGASTTYPYVPVTGNPATPIVNDGFYTITNNVISHPAWFSGALDHTPNDVNGYLAFFNASELPGEFYKQTVTGLCENTKYEFASWIANVLNPAALIGVKPDITFVIQKTDGTILATYSTGPISQKTSLTWEQFGFFFATPVGVSTVVLKMTNTNVGGLAQQGNDFAIDDITFKPCGPTLTASFNSSTIQSTKTQCGFAPVTLFGTASSGYSSPGYLWQISNDNGTTWADLASSNALSYVYTPTSSGTTSFRMLSGESANINSSTCRVASNSITLIINAPPQLSFAGNTICPGQQGQLQFQIAGGVSPYTVVINNGSANSTINNLGTSTNSSITPTPSITTTYSIVSVTDALGCVRTSGFTTSSATITVQPLAVNVSPSTNACSGDSIQLMASGGNQYSWSPSAGLSSANIANPKAAPAGTTTYKVVVSNTGCKDSATTTINVMSKPTLGATPSSSTCAGDSIQLSASGAASYSWSPATGLSNASIANPIASVSSTITYTVTGSSGNGCTDTRNVVITALQKPSIVATNDTSVCGPNSIQLQATGAQQYQWSPATGLSNTAVSNPVATASSSITYRVTGTAANGCKSSDSTVISVLNIPVVAVSNDTSVCKNKSVQLTASGASQYQWSPATGINSSTIANPVATISSPVTYSVKGIALNGCSSTRSINIGLKPSPTLAVSRDTLICSGGAANLNASGGQQYFWSPATGLNNANIATPVAAPTVSTRYFVTATNANGCDATDSITVNVKGAPVFAVSPSTVSICSSKSMQLNATGGDVYLWQPSKYLSNPNISNPVVKPDSSTVYSVIITDTYCNVQSTLSVPVTVSANPIIIVSKDNDITCSQPFSQLKATGAATYLWTPAGVLNNPAINNPIATITSTTTFIVVGTSNGGCQSSDSIKVSFLNGGNLEALQLPNAFTPNGDGLNDCFGIKTWGNVEVSTFNIYNRWGQIVFKGKSSFDCWNGTFKGIPQQTGVFPYVLKVKTACGNVDRQGYVVLVR